MLVEGSRQQYSYRINMLHSTAALSWGAALLLHGVLAAVLLIKQEWRRFPLFVLYVVANFVLGVNCYVLWFAGSPFVYFVTYWTNEGVGLLLGLVVIYEIFNRLFAPYAALKKLAAVVFQSAVVLLVVFGCLIVFLQPAHEPIAMVKALFALEEAGRVLEVGLVIFLFLFASAFGLHWRQYVFGIVLGLGVFTAVELVAVTLRLQFGFGVHHIMSVARMLSFNCSLLIWIGYFLAPELATSPAQIPKRAQLEQWNKAIMELIYQ
jgi:hypothetical protein